MNKTLVLIIFFFISICICSSYKQKTENKSKNNSSIDSYSSSGSSEDQNEYNEENIADDSGCGFEDGTYSATVDYNNPETGYSATYTLEVEVQDCQVVQINFPNDGYLDEDHISYANIDNNGNASVDGEDGKTYEIQIDN